VIAVKKYVFTCKHCGKTYTSTDHEEVKRLGREHLKQAHVNDVMEFVNRFKEKKPHKAKAIKNIVNWAAGSLATVMIREIDAPQALSTKDRSDPDALPEEVFRAGDTGKGGSQLVYRGSPPMHLTVLCVVQQLLLYWLVVYALGCI
jgi:hypothetical protein